MKTATPARPASKDASTKTSRMDQPTKSKADSRFLDNLPCFKATIRGNTVADSEAFTSKAGTLFETYRIAYNRKKGDPSSVMFIKVYCEEGNSVAKGSYVEVSGDYQDELGEYKGNPTIYRTMFARERIKVLINGNEKA